MAIDFNAYLAGDLTYQDALREIAARRTAAELQRNADWYAPLVQYGEIPTLFATGEPLGFDVPQSIRDAAALATSSGFSTVGQLARQYLDAQSLMRGNLGERGLIRSGDYAYLTNRNLYARQLGQATALNALQGGLNQTQRNYLALLDTLRGQQSDAATAAWGRMIDEINAKTAADAAAAAKAAADAAAAARTPAWDPGANMGGSGPPGGGIGAGSGTSSGGINSGPDPYERPSPDTPAAPLPPEPNPWSTWSGNVPDASNDYFVEHQSPDIPQYPAYTPPAPVVPGYGGGATRYQVLRNML
ncbi:MAG TPA: hypothetical protein VKD72_36065 [Gemmataceae bacterium]|nr:hypothetical protein [Gemmataceae bacterium]